MEITMKQEVKHNIIEVKKRFPEYKELLKKKQILCKFCKTPIRKDNVGGLLKNKQFFCHYAYCVQKAEKFGIVQMPDVAEKDD